MAQFLGFAVVSADGTTLHAEGVSGVEHLGVDLYYSTFASSAAFLKDDTIKVKLKGS